MILRSFTMWSTAMLLIASTANAETPGQGTVGEVPPQEKLICKTQQLTGSRLAKRKVCMTRAEWDARQVQLEKEAQMRPILAGDGR